jgi:4-alpha-glucanotransferase
MVDYARAYAHLRPVLEALSIACFEDGPSDEVRAFTASSPRVSDYARFRAAVEMHGAPAHFPKDALDRADPVRVQYHLYAQLRASEQLGAACDAAKGLGVGLYLDMPLGVHPDGYDVYREPHAFLTGLSAGAPPDPLFTGGQKWGFAPLSPSGLRESGYGYVRECLAHQMRGAGVLRLDHVMGLHRLFCIPAPMLATEGVYVQMPHEELYAVASVESHRHQTMLVGEDLGTVPNAVRRAMDRHAFGRMYVLPFELRPNKAMIMGEIPEASVASANTHDLPTWQGWWSGTDIDVRFEMGLLSSADAAHEKIERRRLSFELSDRLGCARDPGPTLEAALRALASSNARLLLVNLEDLWLEAEPQNVPGTHRERPNWRRKARLSLEELSVDARVRSVLSQIDARRKRR